MAAAAAAASRFLGNIPSQVGDAKGKDAVLEYALTTLRDARKHEKLMRRGIKVFSRAAKFFWWTYKLGVTATAGLIVVKVANKVANGLPYELNNSVWDVSWIEVMEQLVFLFNLWKRGLDRWHVFA